MWETADFLRSPLHFHNEKFLQRAPSPRATFLKPPCIWEEPYEWCRLCSSPGGEGKWYVLQAIVIKKWLCLLFVLLPCLSIKSKELWDYEDCSTSEQKHLEPRVPESSHEGSFTEHLVGRDRSREINRVGGFNIEGTFAYIAHKHKILFILRSPQENDYK